MKHLNFGRSEVEQRVAPFTGAWIETADDLRRRGVDLVAPFTGAWIETSSFHLGRLPKRVAPFTGAWIETDRIITGIYETLSRPLHGGVD